MRTRSVTVLLVAALSGLLAACAGQPGGSESDPTATELPATGTPEPSLTLPGTPPVPPPVSPPVSPPVVPPPSTGKPGLVTLTGEVYAGVEMGCLLLATGSGDYLLIGSAAGPLRSGETVTVRGQIRADLATTCQQGTPFEVSEVVD